MLQYILTGLAGIVLGIVGMRVWMARERPAPADASVAPSAASGSLQGTASPVTTRRLLGGAAVLVVAAIAVLALRPNREDAGASGMPAAMAPGAPAGGDQKLDDVNTMIARLADRLKQNPDDGEGFRMLGWSYVMTGHPEKAIAPYKRALKLQPARAIVHSGYGEALVGVAQGTVTPAARSEFEQAVRLDPKEPRARYFLALWQAQNGQQKEALNKWIALANEGPADAPWQADLHRQIAQTSAKLGVDVSARLKSAAPASADAAAPALNPATVQAASALPAGDRQAMIDEMVEGLADKLKTNPGDVDGWVRLLRSRMVLKQGEKARQDLVTARKALADDAAGLQKVNAAAVQFGVPGAR